MKENIQKAILKFDIFHYTRAFAFLLFPDQIVVPFDEELKRPVFKLESLAKANNLDLTRATMLYPMYILQLF